MGSRQQSFHFLNGIERQKWSVSHTQENTLTYTDQKLKQKVQQLPAVHLHSTLSVLVEGR